MDSMDLNYKKHMKLSKKTCRGGRRKTFESVGNWGRFDQVHHMHV